jgi:hypothetical protein
VRTCLGPTGVGTGERRGEHKHIYTVQTNVGEDGARTGGTERKRTARNSGVPDHSFGGGPVRHLQSTRPPSKTTYMQRAQRAGAATARDESHMNLGENGDSPNGWLPRRAESYCTLGGAEGTRTNQYSECEEGDGREYQVSVSCRHALPMPQASLGNPGLYWVAGGTVRHPYQGRLSKEDLLDSPDVV